MKWRPGIRCWHWSAREEAYESTTGFDADFNWKYIEWTIKPEVKEWLDNLRSFGPFDSVKYPDRIRFPITFQARKGKVEYGRSPVIRFARRSDIVLFKLTWGGR